MGSRPPERPPGSLRTRTRLIAAFAIVVLGLLGTEGAILLTVYPQLSALHSIADDHARAVEQASRIRSRLSQMLRTLRAEMARPDATMAPTPISADLKALWASVATLSSLAEDPIERRRVQAFQEAIAQTTGEASALESLSATDPASSRLRAAALVERLGNASAAADEIIAFDARQVEKGAHRVHASLLWALLAASLTGSLGALAALLLLRHALGGLERERAHWRERTAEVAAFAARAAHELRTPLQTVMLALASAEGSGGPTALERALKAVGRLRRTVDDLLEFSRAGVTAGPGAAGIGDAIHEVLDELGAQPGDGHGLVSVDAPPDLYAAIAPGLLRTILRNLVGNALKYGVSQRSTRVQVTATARGETVHIQVLDEGPGIPPDQLPHVFEAFVRATTKPDGFGLGLATVKRVVEAHGGEVSIWSRPEVGTRVSVELPSSPVAACDRPGSASHAPSRIGPAI